MDLDGSWMRMRRENSYLGTKTRFPSDNWVKCSLSRSMSRHRGDSRSSSPSGVRGVVAGSTVLK